jgi:hypothetical protein
MVNERSAIWTYSENIKLAFSEDVTLAFRNKAYKMLKIFHFDKYCNCHLQI